VPIIKTLILDYCQDSNWAFNDYPVQVDGNRVSIRLKDGVDSEVSSSIFSYEIVGRTESGVFIALLAGNEIAGYTITEQTISSDLFNPRPDKVHILTQVGLSSVDCLRSIRVEANSVVIEKNVFDSAASRPEQCTARIETVAYPIRP
jgi:hypothetical protein